MPDTTRPRGNQPDASDLRVRFATILDNETRTHDERFRAAAAIAPGETVVDIGCGTGASTRDAAAASRDGRVLGVDITEGSIEFARALSTEFDNVDFAVADAQTDDLGNAFDIVISRFGVMFFCDPAAAFTNIARSVRAGGRLALLVWQGRERNDWAGLPAAIAGPHWRPDPSDPDPFSLGDPSHTTELLEAAGFADVAFEGVVGPVWYGDDPDVAVEFVSGFQQVRAAIDAAPDPEAARSTVRRIVAEHHSPADGVRFEAATWIVTARRSRA